MEGGRERERERERERKRENKLTNSHHFPLPVWVNFRSILRQLWKGAVNFFYCRRLSNEESMECSHIISACSPEAVQIKAPRLTVYPVTARRTMRFLQGYEHVSTNNGASWGICIFPRKSIAPSLRQQGRAAS